MKGPIAAAFFLTSTVLSGQGVLGVGNFIHVSANLDKSIEFYHDALGLEMTGAPGPRAFSANAIVSSLYDAPGAQSRVASFKIPGAAMAVEIVEFQGLTATRVWPKLGDPGGITLTLWVADLEAVKTRLSRIQGLEWVSAGMGVVEVRDPDGIFVDLHGRPKQDAATPLPALGAEVRLGVTVEDLGKTARFYREALGFTGGAAGQRATVRVPGDGFPVVLSQPNYADRKAVHPAIHDPGAGVLRLRVSDFDGAVKALKAGGATVVSAGGEPVNLGRNRAVILREPNSMFLQVLESAPAAGSGPAGK